MISMLGKTGQLLRTFCISPRVVTSLATLFSSNVLVVVRVTIICAKLTLDCLF